MLSHNFGSQKVRSYTVRLSNWHKVTIIVKYFKRLVPINHWLTFGGSGVQSMGFLFHVSKNRNLAKKNIEVTIGIHRKTPMP